MSKRRSPSDNNRRGNKRRKVEKVSGLTPFWLFDSDWISVPTDYRLQVLKFIVEEFKINLKEVKLIDLKHNNRGTSFINYVITRLATTPHDGYANFNLITYACDEGLGLEDVDDNNRTPLLTAIEAATPCMSLFLLLIGASPNYPEDSLPLCKVMEEHMENVKLFKFIDMLLTYGADINKFCVNEINQPTFTALMIAAKEQQVDVSKYLVMRGAKIDLENKDGHNALHMAIDSRKSEVVEFLAKYVDINKPNRDGLSPLHMAVTPHQHPFVAKALLKNGADVNQVVPHTLKTPAMMACTEPKDFLILEELLKYGVDIKARDIEGHSLVYYFVKHFKANHTFSPKDAFLARIKHLMTDENFSFFFDEAKNVLEQAKKDSALLNNIFALCTSTQYFAEFLIDHVGFDINMQDGQGNVLLSYLMNEETFMYLMTKKPNVSIKNNDGKTPLTLMIEREDQRPSKNVLDALTKRSNEH